MIAAIVYLIGGFIEVLIALRIILRLVGANPSSAFVNWVYDWSTPFVKPFAGILGQDATIAGQGAVTVSVFDWTAVVAFVVIGLILMVIGAVSRR